MSRSVLAVASVILAGILMMTLSSSNVRAATTLYVPNGMFEDGIQKEPWISALPVDSHQVPVEWSVYDYETVLVDYTDLYPITKVVTGTGSHLDVLSVDTATGGAFGAIHSSITFASATVKIPSDALNIRFSLDILKYVTSDATNEVEIHVLEFMTGIVFLDVTHTKTPDGLWTTHESSIKTDISGKTVRVSLGVISVTHSEEARVLLDNVGFVFDTVIPEFPAVVLPAIGVIAIVAAMSLAKPRKR